MSGATVTQTFGQRNKNRWDQRNKPKRYHPKARAAVLAVAMPNIYQAQVAMPGNGLIQSIFIWECGPDVFFSETRAGLFSKEECFKAEKWLVDALKAHGKALGARGETIKLTATPNHVPTQEKSPTPVSNQVEGSEELFGQG